MLDLIREVVAPVTIAEAAVIGLFLLAIAVWL